jgi:hypothetical protein
MAKKVVVAVKYPEVGTVDAKALKKVCKALSDAEIAEWVHLYDLQVKEYGHDSINRMRRIMAITGLHFPGTVKPAKAKSKYAEYTDLQLIEWAIAESVPVLLTDDTKIMRMRVIMALKAHGKLA